jgi:hypothetical protein
MDKGKKVEGKTGKIPTNRPATEKPSGPSARKVSRYTVLVEDDTGVIARIEKVDPKTQQSRELTAEEYGLAYAFASYSAPYYASLAASMFDPLNSAVVRAYYKGLSDYVKALTENA